MLEVTYCEVLPKLSNFSKKDVTMMNFEVSNSNTIEKKKFGRMTD